MRARHFGFTLQESYQLDQRCRMLCEGHAEVLHKTNEWRTAKKQHPKSFLQQKQAWLGSNYLPLPFPPKKKETHHPYGGSHSCQSNLFLAPNRVVKGVLFVKETLRGLTWLWPLHRTFRCVGRVLTLFDSPLMGAKSCWQRNYCNMWVVSSFFLQASFVHLKWQSFLRFLGCDLKPAAVAWFLGSFKSDAERVMNAAGCAG